MSDWLSVQIQILSLIQFVLLDLWPVKDGLCRPILGGQKLHFLLVIECFVKSGWKFAVSKILWCWIRIWRLKYMNTSGNYAILMFQLDLEFPETVKNGQLPMEFWDCGIADSFKSFCFWKCIPLGNFWKKFHFLYIYAHIFIPCF